MRLFRIGLVVLSLAWVATQLYLAWDDAPTVDEPMHLFDGALQLDLGNSYANPEHPPLVKMLGAAAATPWRGRPALPPIGSDARGPASAYLVRPAATVFSRIFAARLPAVAVGLLAILAAALWGRRMAGPAGGLAAAALLASSTLYGAHAHLLTTDVAVASFTFCGAYLLVGEPGKRWSAPAAGVCLGLALASKFSGLFLAPAVLVLGAVELARRRQRAGRALVAAAAAAATLLAVVSFAARRTTAPEVRRQIAAAERGRTTNLLDASAFPAALAAADRAAAISPGTGRYVLGAVMVASPAYRKGAYPAFFHGRISTEGNWLYFPACLAFKWGTGAAAAAILGLWAGFSRRRRAEGFAPGLTAVVLPLAYFAMAVPSHYQLGARYLLPMFPFLALWAAPLAARRQEAPSGVERARRFALALLAGLSLLGAAASFPFWMADSSSAGRLLGPIDAWFADSNLDWGQDLRRIARGAEAIGTPVYVVSGSEFDDLSKIFPSLRFPEARDPLPGGAYSVTRWGPFLAAAARPAGLACFPRQLRPLLAKLHGDYEEMARQPEIPRLSTPSMRGFLWKKGP
jgi:4-amino-4-deoxy-L-arabinose transferase-like glycosyltransferase